MKRLLDDEAIIDAMNSEEVTLPVAKIVYFNEDEDIFLEAFQSEENESKSSCLGILWTRKFCGIFEAKLLDEIRNFSLLFTNSFKNIHTESKRKLIKLSFLRGKDEAFDRALNTIEKKLIDIVHDELHLNNYSLWNGTVLLSHPGCSLQKWHQDYCEKTFKNSVPYSIVIAIDVAKLDICSYGVDYSKELHDRLFLDRGDILFFNGFAFHRGCEYDSLSFRLHFYLQRNDEHIRTIGCSIYSC